MAKHSKVKLLMAEDLTPATPATGNSLEEQINAFLATLADGDILDVIIETGKTGKFGQNPVFTAAILYKG
jgi:hypothetical protein